MSMINKDISLGHLITIITLIIAIGVAYGGLTVKQDAQDKKIRSNTNTLNKIEENYVSRRELQLYINNLKLQYENLKLNQQRILDYMESNPREK